ncbi:dihydrofolate reductase, partial [Rhizobium ruizarguesonis]
WWGDEPPFWCPVFVLTHKPRPSIEMAGGTTFHFLNTTPDDALQQAMRVDKAGFEIVANDGRTAAYPHIVAVCDPNSL